MRTNHAASLGVIIFVLFSASTGAFVVPLGIDGTIYNESQQVFSGEALLTIRNLRSNDTLTIEVGDGTYSAALRGEVGDEVELKARTGSRVAERIVLLEGVLHDVDLYLGQSGENKTYPEPIVTGVPQPFFFFGAIRWGRNPSDGIVLVNNRTAEMYAIAYDENRPEYVLAINGRRGDRLAVLAGERSFAGEVTFQKEWQRVDIDVPRAEFFVVDGQERPTLEPRRRSSGVFWGALAAGVLLVGFIVLKWCRRGPETSVERNRNIFK